MIIIIQVEVHKFIQVIYPRRKSCIRNMAQLRTLAMIFGMSHIYQDLYTNVL